MVDQPDGIPRNSIRVDRFEDGGSSYVYEFRQEWPDGRRNTLHRAFASDYGSGVEPLVDLCRALLQDAMIVASKDPEVWGRFRQMLHDFNRTVGSERHNANLRRLWRKRGYIDRT